MENAAVSMTSYQEVRALSIKVNSALLHSLPQDMFKEGARTLGVLHDNTLVVDGEQQMAVVMDYCIHDVRRNGRNAVELLLADGAASLSAPEVKYLEALRQARFSYWQVEQVERGAGVRVRDLLNGDVRFVADLTLSTTAPAGAIFAARLLTYEGQTLTTGAVLGVGMFGQHQAAERFVQGLAELQAQVGGDSSAESVGKLNGLLIQLCFQMTGGPRPAVASPPRGVQRMPDAGMPSRGTRVGRNKPCPCGSGKKFKHCCGGRI